MPNQEIAEALELAIRLTRVIFSTEDVDCIEIGEDWFGREELIEKFEKALNQTNAIN